MPFPAKNKVINSSDLLLLQLISRQTPSMVTSEDYKALEEEVGMGIVQYGHQ